MENLVIKNAKVLGGGFRNFEGRATSFKPAGDRTFVVELDEDQAATLSKLGWNIQTKECNDEITYRLKISVRFDRMPPDIRMYTNGKTVYINENNANLLDRADFEKVGLVVRPYVWTMANGKSGVKAMLGEGRFKIKDSVLDEEFSIYENDTDSVDLPYED